MNKHRTRIITSFALFFIFTFFGCNKSNIGNENCIHYIDSLTIKLDSVRLR